MRAGDGEHRSPLDVLIVGAGAAGLTAATMLGRARRRVAVLSLRDRRNSPATSVHNIPYAEGVPPAELYARLEEDAGRYGVEFIWDRATNAKQTADGLEITTGRGSIIRARRLLLAVGMENRLPEWLPEGVWGRSAFDCPYCHATEFEGDDFVVAGDGAGAVALGACVIQLAKSLTVIVGNADLLESPLARRLEHAGGRFLIGAVESATRLPGNRIGMRMVDGEVIEAGALLLSRVKTTNLALADDLDLAFDERGYLRTEPNGRTSNPMVWRAGNYHDTAFMWIGAASSGVNAARSINEEIAYQDDLVAWRPPVDP